MTGREHLNADVGATSSEVSRLPYATCTACQRQYWACACGAAPVGTDPGAPPTVCRNPYCNQHRFRWVTARLCCQRDYHHVGAVCTHCGADG